MDSTPALWKPLCLILATLMLILINAFWVAAEFAIVRSRRTRLMELAGQGHEEAKSAIIIIDSISNYLALTQVGITIASLAVGWLSESAVNQLLLTIYPAADFSGSYHAIAICIAFFIVTVLHVLLGEQVPKLLAVRNAERYLLIFERPLRFMNFFFKPALQILEWSTTWILRRIGHGKSSHVPLSEEELKLILEDSHAGGVVSDGEAEIITHAFEFADKETEEVMIPANQVSYISFKRSLEENLETAKKFLHSRFPVCLDDIDSVIGTVSIKDVWPLLEIERSNNAFEMACKQPIFIPVNFSQDDILKALRDAHGHIGVVRDYTNQKTMGIVTLEDILESLVGDIREINPYKKPNSLSTIGFLT